MTTFKAKCIELKTSNPTWGYRRIATALCCSHNTVRYHLDDKTREYFRIARKKNRRLNLDQIKIDFGGKCVMCGYHKCLDALAFHHTDPSTKTGEISSLMKTNGKAASYLEAKKCILLCMNCHQEIHTGQCSAN